MDKIHHSTMQSIHRGLTMMDCYPSKDPSNFGIIPPSRAVSLCIRELGLDVDMKEMNLFQRKNLDPQYLEMNPQHTVPMIVDDGFILWDSHAINTYLVSKFGKNDSLYPKDLKKRAIVDQRLNFEGTLFSVLRSFTIPIFSRKTNQIPDEKISEMQHYYEILSKILGDNKWIAGDEITVADFSYAALLSGVQGVIPGIEKHTNLLEYIERCEKTMKGYNEVNKPGAEKFIETLNDLIKN